MRTTFSSITYLTVVVRYFEYYEGQLYKLALTIKHNADHLSALMVCSHLSKKKKSLPLVTYMPVICYSDQC